MFSEASVCSQGGGRWSNVTFCLVPWFYWGGESSLGVVALRWGGISGPWGCGP